MIANAASSSAQSQDRLPSKSIGAKFFLVLLLAAIMSIPAFFVDSLASQRATARGATTTYSANGAPIPPHTVLGIKLADSYRAMERSLKYITLILGLVFLTYFLFEVTSGKRMHPGQYALVGVAQTVFYLLLLSLAEYIGFDFAYLVAGLATVLLFSINTKWLFKNTTLSVRAFTIFSLLYSFIYVLLRLEYYALLIGSIVSFSAVAATMYLTRNIDWYGTSGAVFATSNATSTSRDSWLE
jgi:inner membrane protein involved in colicin E2 resistance